MSRSQRIVLLLAAVVVAVVAAVVIGGGGDDDDTGTRAVTAPPAAATPAVTDSSAPPPKPREETIRIVGGQPRGGVHRLEYEKGDEVVLEVRSDTADEIHIHGYDLSKDVAAGGRVRFRFEAKIDGQFEIEMEHAGREIAALVVNP